MCGVKTAKKGCSSSWTTVLSTSWYVRSFVLFCKLLFSWIASWIAFDNFFKNFQETYNIRLRERYGDNPSTHPDFDPDLWMEVGSSGRPDKNQVYRLSNTTAQNLCSARSVSTVGSSPSVSSTQSEEFIALKQQYQQLSMNYDELRQIVMEMRSKMGDDTCAAPFWPYGPRNNQPPPPPPTPPLF
jgi:hypothetical protein